MDDARVSAKTKTSLYASGTINPYSISTYPSGAMIGEPSSRVLFSLNVIASTQLLLIRCCIFHLDGVVLFTSPKSGSSIVPVEVVNGPRSTVPTFVCILTTTLFAGTCSLYTTNGAASVIKLSPLDA